MTGIKSGASQRVTDTPKSRDSAVGLAPRQAAPFSRAARTTTGVDTVRLSGPKAVAAALISRCNAYRAELQARGVKDSDFLGHDGHASVFSDPERAEVCIQTGADVCTVKSDGRVFLNGDPLERHQPGFLQMQRTLADLGAKVAAGGLDRKAGAADGCVPGPSPWDRTSPAHVNYVL